MNKIKVFKGSYYGEVKDHLVYKALADYETDEDLKKKLLKISAIEKGHSEFWKHLLDQNNVTIVPKSFVFTQHLYVFLRRFLGYEFLSKLLEINENKGIKDYYEIYKSDILSESDKKIFKKIIMDELVHEDVFSKTKTNNVDNIRDIFLGMNDSFVEVLSVTAGLVSIYPSNPLLIAVTGLLIGCGGTLSMGIGTYISVKNQKQVKEQQLLEKKIVHDLEGKSERIPELSENPLKSGIYTGSFYLIGTTIIVTPFFLFSHSLYSFLTSLGFAVLAWTVGGSVIALSSGLSIKKKVFEMVGLGILAAFITFSFGYIISSVFGIQV